MLKIYLLKRQMLYFSTNDKTYEIDLKSNQKRRVDKKKINIIQPFQLQLGKVKE